MHEQGFRSLNFVEAIREGLDLALEQDPSVLVIGEGVPDPKAIFTSTAGLQQKYGSQRVFDMPLAENGLTGVCIGAAISGMRPVMIHQRIDFAMLAMDRNNQRQTLVWLAITGLFGLAFLGIELYEFAHLIHEGATPQRSAFLSAFFTLVGTHGLHVTFGIIWLVTLMVQVSMKGLIPANKRRLMCLSMFWHFLDVIWIGVFTFVYLLGVLR